uniref:Cytochrome P-450 RebP n=1 Tax=Lentzea aerocolonigenes TaxID=68170 RepID=Q8KIC8_LENAE|nr:cytochrome P450 enzyme [Lentzea aerocolonigenes]BAC10677.1 putative cytochrome P450 [Lentzea aerocolonigenes]BAC15753.1 cytochrome P-450 RebP [Lentzea aerocolonigenes]CAC93717.1 putative P450 protein [Lentzea aerocolonigenes]
MKPFDLKAFTGADLADPYPVYREYLTGDPVHHNGEAWYVFGYDGVAHVLTSRDYGRRGPGGRATPIPPSHDTLSRIVENWLVFLDPPRHTALRSLLAKEFSPAVVTGLRERVRKIAGELLAGLGDAGEIDLVEDFAAPLPILVISELLGVPARLRSWFRRCAVDLQEASTARATRNPGALARADGAASELVEFFGGELGTRKPDDEDLVALLVNAQRRGEALTDEEIVSTCVHLLTAGHETTTNLISKSVLALLANPAAAAEPLAGLDVTPQVVEELNRFDTPVQMVTRWAHQDTALGGKPIRRGDKVVLVLGSANRDPAAFAEPDRLDLRRDSRRHCGFGLGIHYCLGAALARTEAEIGLSVLFTNFPGLRLGGEPVRYADDLVFHGPARLPMLTR